MPKGSLPGYIWRTSTQSYARVLADGGLEGVARQEIIAVLQMLSGRSTIMLGDLLIALLDGKLTQTDALLAGTQLLKDLYNANSALARGGWSQMTPAAWGRNGQILRAEYRFFRNFLAEIVQGNLSAAQIRSRAHLYIGRAYSRFWAEDRLLKLESGDFESEEWLDVGDERECSDCPRLAALGKVPLGTLRTVPGAGDTECTGACRCILVYS